MPGRRTIIFLADGMADEPVAELGCRTPLQCARTPFMDAIAREGCCGTLLTLPDGFPTSSEVANMSVLPIAVGMNLNQWNSLPQDVKKVFDDLCLSASALCGVICTIVSTTFCSFRSRRHSSWGSPVCCCICSGSLR